MGFDNWGDAGHLLQPTNNRETTHACVRWYMKGRRHGRSPGSVCPIVPHVQPVHRRPVQTSLDLTERENHLAPTHSVTHLDPEIGVGAAAG